MKGPYPDILFHFTSLNGLKGIIKEGFRPSYARESIEGPSSKKEFSVPMVSFCDLRLSELPFHMKKYKKFGIGLTKEWAQRMGLNPVAYISKDSEFTRSLIAGFEAYHKRVTAIGDWNEILSASSEYLDLLNIERYIKNYEGDLVRGAKTIPNYRFADEREWRYVLPLAIKGVLPFMPAKLIKSRDQKTFYNDQIQNYILKFNATDVKYLIVAHERNINPMQRYIEGLPLTPLDQQHLSARILTAPQIESDM